MKLVVLLIFATVCIASKKSGVEAYARCSNSQLFGPTGQFVSHTYFGRYDYPSDFSCHWTITVAEDRIIEITFDFMDIEYERNCRYDYLMVHDGGSNADKILARLCGRRIPSPIRSSRNKLHFRFFTDRPGNKRGFKISWKSVTPPAHPGNTECGKKKIPHFEGNDLRIVGGRDARPGSWPWQVQILVLNKHHCGGTLVNREWVVTAAHCVVKDPSPSRYTLALGSFYKSVTDYSQKNMKADKIIMHPWYYHHPSNPDFDLALIHLTEKVHYSDHISPACIANFQFPAGSLCYATGWGFTGGTGHAHVLKQAQVPIVDNNKCNAVDYHKGKITVRMICAGHIGGGHNTCWGDSGGPLVCPVGSGKDAKWFLFGATSWGPIPCANYNPAVYASLPNMYDWVIRTIGE